jgi:hypothetical protein
MFSSNTSQVSSGGYEIQRSLRFNGADAARLNRTPASAGNRKTWTYSTWIKRSALSSPAYLFGNLDGSGLNGFGLQFQTDNTLEIFDYSSSAFVWRLAATQVFRDPSAWYHFVLVFDTTQATSTNRVRFYVNGVEVTSFTTATYPTLNYDGYWNNTSVAAIGRTGAFNGQYFNGYITETNFIDGQALTPSSFGAFDAQTGVWGPTPYAGSYGTNGFYLNFSDNSNTTATTLGKDYSPNGNNWTPNNFSVSAGAGNDSLVDVPTNWGTDTGVGGSVRGNYCTLNPLGTAGAIPTNGNLAVSSSSTVGNRISTILLTTGKWYWEGSGNGYVGAIIGVDGGAFTGSTSATGSRSIGYWFDGGLAFWDGGNSGTGTGYNSTDVIGVALDMDIGNVKFYKNNTLIHNLTFGSGTVPNLSTGVYAGYNVGANTASVDFNFGQRPFAYTAPSGFKALNTQNLPTPTIGATTATQANRYFDVLTYTGNGSATQAITGLNFQPDFSWVKNRSDVVWYAVVDAVRTTAVQLDTTTTADESSSINIKANYGGLSSFDSGGITVSSGSDGTYKVTNGSGQTYVAWNWRASNAAGVTNTAGSITSTVSANTTSGFSIATFSLGATGSKTVGHGLGVAPSMIIVKNRTTPADFPGWYVYHISTGNGQYLTLNTTGAAVTTSTIWDNTSPTSSVFTLGAGFTSANQGPTQVAYCFAEVPGYSRFGSYTGNGSSDGPFVFCGFRPAYVMVKTTGTPNDWAVFDVARNTFNSATGVLYPNLSNAEAFFPAGGGIDILSNGFKMRADGLANGNGNAYIFAAFASAPQKFALAR